MNCSAICALLFSRLDGRMHFLHISKLLFQLRRRMFDTIAEILLHTCKQLIILKSFKFCRQTKRGNDNLTIAANLSILLRSIPRTNYVSLALRASHLEKVMKLFLWCFASKAQYYCNFKGKFNVFIFYSPVPVPHFLNYKASYQDHNF